MLLEAELKWNNFNIDEDDMTRVGKFWFVNSNFDDLPLTLAISPTELRIPDVMEPYTSFECSLPIKCLDDISNGNYLLIEYFFNTFPLRILSIQWILSTY